MRKTTQTTDSFGKNEAKRRFEAALRGARVAEPQPMKSMPPKRSAPQEKERRPKKEGGRLGARR